MAGIKARIRTKIKTKITGVSGCRKQNGSTMVEVIVSFAMLVVLIAMFSNVFLMCSRMTLQATKLMEENARLCEAYYLKERTEAELVREGGILFERIDENQENQEADSFSVEDMELYRHTSTEGLRGAIYDVFSGEQD